MTPVAVLQTPGPHATQAAAEKMNNQPGRVVGFCCPARLAMGCDLSYAAARGPGQHWR